MLAGQTHNANIGSQANHLPISTAAGMGLAHTDPILQANIGRIDHLNLNLTSASSPIDCAAN